ncbi:MAG: hypothetical protein R2824_24960 [Saprospiraceae bacterium]|nr:hypothetical protein [Lewinella sp.]
MDHTITCFKPLFNFRASLAGLFVIALMFSCNSNDDDDMSIDLDAPVIQETEALSVRGGESITFSFSIIAPGTIAEVTVAAGAGTASISNEASLIGSTSGMATIQYTTTTEMSGLQSVTLTVVDEQGKTAQRAAGIEVFAPIAYGLAMVSGAGDVTTTFIQGLIDLDITTVDNSSATELGQYAAIYSDGQSLFTAGFGAPATMGKFVFNSAGAAVLDQEIIVPGSNSFSAVEIIDNQTAYATVGGGLSRAVVFSPAEMRITGEIDLTDAGEGLFYSDMIVRDPYLFIALNDFGGSGMAKVAVVDLRTNQLEKIIEDDRTATLFGTLPTAIMAMDEDDNIYVQGSGLFSDKPSGILRIKAGEDAFDPDYFFNLSETTGSSCFGLYHFGGGLTFTAISENDDNWFGSDGNAPSFRYHKIDLDAQQSSGDPDAALPNTFAASKTMFFLQVSENELLFPIAGKDEDALYSYDIDSGAVSKKIDLTSGYASGLVPVQ